MNILGNILKSKPDFAPANSQRKNNKDSYALCYKNRSSTTPVSPLSKVAKIVSKKQPSIAKPVVLNLFDCNGISAKTKIGTSGNICIVGGSDTASSRILQELKTASLKQNTKLKEIDAKKFCALSGSALNQNKPKNHIVHIDISKENELTIFNTMYYCKVHICLQLDGVSLNSKLEGVKITGSKNIQILQSLHGHNQIQKNKLVASLKNDEFALMTHLNQCVRCLSEDFNLMKVADA